MKSALVTALPQSGQYLLIVYCKSECISFCVQWGHIFFLTAKFTISPSYISFPVLSDMPVYCSACKRLDGLLIQQIPLLSVFEVKLNTHLFSVVCHTLNFISLFIAVY